MKAAITCDLVASEIWFSFYQQHKFVKIVSRWDSVFCTINSDNGRRVLVFHNWNDPLVMKQIGALKCFLEERLFFNWIMSTEFFMFFFSCFMNRETDVSLATLLSHSYIFFSVKGKAYKEIWNTSQVYYLSEHGCVLNISSWFINI